MSILARLSGALTFAACLSFAACGGDGGNETPTPTATAEATPTPTTVVSTPQATGSPPETSYRLVYREFTPTEDIIWRAVPSDPTQREELARIPHREGYGIKPALSPDGKFLAYLTLPDYALSAQSSQAEAYLMNLETKESVKIDQGIDLGYTPMWAPDGRLLYFRKYAGPEFLAADVSVVRARIAYPDDPTPTPTPTPGPDGAPFVPAPVPPAIEEVLRDSVAHVLAFAPIGFADDGKSMFFVQVQGGTGGGTLVGIYTAGTTESANAYWAAKLEAQRIADEENRQLVEQAIAAGQPVPEVTVTPRPVENPARFVVELSDQVARDYELSLDGHKVSYLVQEFAESGEILNKAYVADLIAATAAAFPAPGLSVGHHLRPVWYPDSGSLTIGVLPSQGGAGQLALVAVDSSRVLLLAQAEAGFDQPRSWSPDGTWLAVAHSSGDSLANPGAGRLDLVSVNGHRVTVIEGVDNASEDSVIGWVQVGESATEAPSG